jgi:hypothetical protein
LLFDALVHLVVAPQLALVLYLVQYVYKQQDSNNAIAIAIGIVIAIEVELKVELRLEGIFVYVQFESYLSFSKLLKGSVREVYEVFASQLKLDLNLPTSVNGELVMVLPKMQHHDGEPLVFSKDRRFCRYSYCCPCS